MKNLFLATAAIVALSTGAGAANIVITSDAPTVVTVAGTTFTAYDSVEDRRGTGLTTVNGTRPATLVSASDNGSLEIRGDRSCYVIGNLFGNANSAGFSFQSLNSLTIDWNADVNGTGQRHASPVTRVVVADTGRPLGRAELGICL